MPLRILSDHLHTELLSKYKSSFSLSEVSTRDRPGSKIETFVNSLLENPGNLVRAQLCLATVQSKASDIERIGFPIALGVEYYHLASLLLDDLPCMDNASSRRGKASAHVQFGQANAILMALALINKAYGLIWSVIGELPQKQTRACALLIEDCLGSRGIVDGQCRDLAFSTDSEKSFEEITLIADRKTGSLFRLSMVLPALAVESDSVEIDALEELSLLFGRTYQLVDDFKDVYGSSDKTGKPKRDVELDRPNIVRCIGKKEAIKYLRLLLSQTDDCVVALCKQSDSWHFYRALWLKLDYCSKPFANVQV